MATSAVSICNLALKRVGAGRIEDLDEDSAEAAACNDVYEHCRDVLLQSFWWPFAKRRATVAQISDGERTGWEYAYALPTNCLAVRYFYAGTRRPNHSGRIPFEIELNEAGTSRLISSDAYTDAEIVYTARITNVSLFSPLFTDALAWLIAKEIALPLTKNPALADMAFKMYEGAKSRAQAAAINEGHDVTPRGELIASRG